MKEVVTLKQHAVVTLHREEEVHKMFLNPGNCVESYTRASVKQGWDVYSIQLCTVEEFYNYRVDDVVESINELTAERESLHDQFRKGVLSLDEYMNALNVTWEFEMSDLRRLFNLMNRLAYLGADCRNEEAHQLYSTVF